MNRPKKVAMPRIVAELDALQAEVDALKHLQAETAVKNTGRAAADPPSSDFGETGRRDRRPRLQRRIVILETMDFNPPGARRPGPFSPALDRTGQAP